MNHLFTWPLKKLEHHTALCAQENCSSYEQFADVHRRNVLYFRITRRGRSMRSNCWNYLSRMKMNCWLTLKRPAWTVVFKISPTCCRCSCMQNSNPSGAAKHQYQKRLLSRKGQSLPSDCFPSRAGTARFNLVSQERFTGTIYTNIYRSCRNKTGDYQKRVVM